MRLPTLLLLPLVFYFPASSLAQQALSPAQIEQEYQLFRSILTEGHPDLYAYTPEAQWDSLFTEFEEKQAVISTDLQLFRQLNGLAIHSRDGHVQLFGPPSIDPTKTYFPLILRIIAGEFYTDTEYAGIPLGSQLLTVNGMSSEELLRRFEKYAATDGWNQSRKDRDIELKFGLLYTYEFGLTETYEVAYVSPAKEQKAVRLPGEDFEIIKRRNAGKASYFSAYHGYSDPMAYFQARINPQNPTFYVIDSLETAVLTVNSFGVDIREFKSELVRIFQQLKKARVKHLIVDVRRNDGGFWPNAMHLFSFLTKHPYQQTTTETVQTLTIPAPAAVTRSFLNPDTFLMQKFASHQEGERWVRRTKEPEKEVRPHKFRFRGDVQVLIGGSTFSAASNFARDAKHDPDIRLLGEETGGGYFFHMGNFPVYYQLPHSKIQLVISLVRIEFEGQEPLPPAGRGVLPDVAISLQREDLLLGRDPVLDAALREIRAKEKN